MQNIEFERLYANSGAKTRSQFILSAIFGRPLKVVKIDKAATDFYIRLTNLQSDYRRVGVNYNQVAKAVHSGELTEKKALALLYKLEQLTVEYISLNKEIIRLRSALLQPGESGKGQGPDAGMEPHHGTSRRHGRHPRVHAQL